MLPHSRLSDAEQKCGVFEAHCQRFQFFGVLAVRRRDNCRTYRGSPLLSDLVLCRSEQLIEEQRGKPFQ
jgi:hypothetical protein